MVGALVHVVATVEFSIIVLGPTAVNGVLNVSVIADRAFILTSLAHDARRNIY